MKAPLVQVLVGQGDDTEGLVGEVSNNRVDSLFFFLESMLFMSFLGNRWLPKD